MEKIGGLKEMVEEMARTAEASPVLHVEARSPDPGVAIGASRIPLRYRTCKMEQLTTISGNETAMKAVREFVPVDGKGLLLTGPVGTGKTHMAVARVIELIKRGHRAVFVPAAELLMDLRRAYDGESTESDVMAIYSNAEVLLLDDLGAERVTEWTKQVFYVLINRRYNAMRSTIVTTNLTPAQLGDVFDQRVVSRLTGMCRVVGIVGDDWRRKR